MADHTIRHEALKALTNDHHQGLLLCWKIREGLKHRVSHDRIKKYCDFYFTSQLRPHFKFEEEEIFPLLGEDHPMITRAIQEHRRLESLFKEEACNEMFTAIETELNRHINFEEMELFRELQRTLSDDELRNITNKEKQILTPDPEDWEDQFWKKDKLL